MDKWKGWYRCTLLLLSLIGAMNTVQAGSIVDTLGNGGSGLADDGIYELADILAVQSGQTAPFDAAIGNDLLGPNFSAAWQHSFGPVTDTISSAIFAFGIYDHDSAASGDQVSAFTINGFDLTAELNGLMNAPAQGGDAQFDIFALDLSQTILDSLVGGTGDIALDLAGPGLVPTLFPLGSVNPPTESAFNGAYLIYSSLDITTEDAPPSTVPETPVYLLLFLGLAMLIVSRRRFGH